MEKQDEKKLPDDLILNPDGTAIYTINEEGSVNGSYKGVFKLRAFLTPLETLEAGRIFRELLGPYGADAGEQDRFMAFCISQLQKRVIKGPPWWSTDSALMGNIPDSNILSLILDRSITAESVYKERLKAKKEEALKKADDATKVIQERLEGKDKKEEDEK
jgi:hypothetical protein